MSIGERLRRERVRAGLTQVELAARLVVSRGYVWKVEHGVKRPSKRMLERWSAATGTAHADLVLEGPALFDLAFPIEHALTDPFVARRMLDHVPASTRRQVAVWPSSGDAVLRLRARGSALPSAVGLAGTIVRGIGPLGDPSVVPVRAAEELVAWVRAANERGAIEQIEARMGCAAAHGRLSIASMGVVFVARVADLSARASIALQELVEESPIGLFVPAPM
jgi:transcriptional regulator with XRE-family HTH domain